jgi:hypothetical protein
VRALAALTEDFAWLQARTGCALTPDARGVKAVRPDGSLAALVAYDMWTENAVQVHLAFDTPAAWRCLARAAFAYPFEEAQKGVLWGCASASNARLLRFARRLGFLEAGRIPDGISRGDDLVLFHLRREDCRHLATKETP